MILRLKYEDSSEYSYETIKQLANRAANFDDFKRKLTDKMFFGKTDNYPKFLKSTVDEDISLNETEVYLAQGYTSKFFTCEFEYYEEFHLTDEEYKAIDGCMDEYGYSFEQAVQYLYCNTCWGAEYSSITNAKAIYRMFCSIHNVYDEEEAEEIAEKLRESDEWDLDLCARLCELAGLKEEWDAADGESFEAIIYDAADELGVDVI